MRNYERWVLAPQTRESQWGHQCIPYSLSVLYYTVPYSMCCCTEMDDHCSLESTLENIFSLPFLIKSSCKKGGSGRYVRACLLLHSLYHHKGGDSEAILTSRELNNSLRYIWELVHIALNIPFCVYVCICQWTLSHRGNIVHRHMAQSLAVKKANHTLNQVVDNTL